jgi:hypothetical protein
MRAMGFPVRTIAFGEAVTAEMRRGHQIYRPFKERLEVSEDRYVYVNRRAQMYGELSLLVDPNGGVDGLGGSKGWTLPFWGAAAKELERQLSMMPRLLDKEGRLRMLPKSKNTDKSVEKTLTEILGCSPDEGDAAVLATHGVLHPQYRAKAGVG